MNDTQKFIVKNWKQANKLAFSLGCTADIIGTETLLPQHIDAIRQSRQLIEISIELLENTEYQLINGLYK